MDEAGLRGLCRLLGGWGLYLPTCGQELGIVSLVGRAISRGVFSRQWVHGEFSQPV